MSQLVKDEMIPSIDLSVYWIEYVLRHNGTKHLQLASRNLPFYQNYLLDVWFFILAIAIALLLITYIFIFYLLRKCFSSKQIPLKTKIKTK